MFLFCLSKVYVTRKERLLKQATKPLKNSLSHPPKNSLFADLGALLRIQVATHRVNWPRTSQVYNELPSPYNVLRWLV